MAQRRAIFPPAHRFRVFVAIAIAALMFSFPAWLNESPYLFPDSDAYYRNGRSVISKIIPTNSKHQTERDSAPATTGLVKTRNLDVTLLGARSPFYGVLLYVSSLFGGPFAIVAVQALAAAAVIWFATSAFLNKRVLSSYLLLCLALTIGSSLPWFVSFVMPDLWLSLALLMLGISLYGRRHLNVAVCVALTTLVSAASAFHSSNMAVMLLAAPAAIALASMIGVTRQHIWRVSAWAGLGLALSVAAGMIFGYAAQRKFGEPLRSPIFATARVVADGPGRDYLRTVCAKNPSAFTLCKYRSLPLESAESILWSPDPRIGVYTVADYDTRVALSKEQWKFVLASIAFEPVRMFFAAAANAFDQATRISLENFEKNFWELWSHDSYWSNQPILALVPKASVCLRTPQTCEPQLAVTIFDRVQQLATIAALAFLLWQLKSVFVCRNSTHRRLVALSAFFLVCYVANAIICGALSGPSDRYQARISWLLLAAAGLIASHRYSKASAESD